MPVKKYEGNVEQTSYAPLYRQQLEKELLNAAVDETNQVPKKEFEKKRHVPFYTRDVEKDLANLEGNLFPDYADPIKNQYQGVFARDIPQSMREGMGKHLKTKTLLKNKGKFVDSTHARRSKLLKDAEDYIKESLPKHLAPYASMDMRNHSGARRSAANYTGKILNKAFTDIAALEEGADERAFERAERHSERGLKSEADIAAMGLQGDVRKLESLKGLRDVNQEERQNLIQQSHSEMNRHKLKHADEQASRSEEHDKYLEARDAEKKKLEWLAAISQNRPTVNEVTAIHNRTRPKHETDASLFGNMATGLGMFGLGGSFAKGGRVRNRCALSTGGTINPMNQAMNNAVINHLDPLTSLQNINHHEIMTDLLKRKMAYRKAMKKGEDLHPLQAGSKKAQEYAHHHSFLKKAREMQEPRKENPLLGAIEALLGTLEKEDDSPLSRIGKTINKSRKRRLEREAAEEARKRQGLTLEYGITKDIEAGQRADRSLTNQEKQSEAQLAHYKAQEAHHKAMESLAREKAHSKPALTASQEKSLETADKMISTGSSTQDKIDRQLEISKKMGNHPILGSIISGLVGIPLVGDLLSYIPKKALAGVSDAEYADINEFINHGRSIVLDTHQNMKNIPRSGDFVKMIEDTKQKIGEHDTNRHVAPTLKKAAQGVVKAGENIYSRVGREPEHESSLPSIDDIDSKIADIDAQIAREQRAQKRQGELIRLKQRFKEVA